MGGPNAKGCYRYRDKIDKILFKANYISWQTVKSFAVIKTEPTILSLYLSYLYNNLCIHCWVTQGSLLIRIHAYLCS